MVILAFLLLYALALHPTSRSFVSDRLGVASAVQIDIDAVLTDLSASALAAREGTKRDEAKASAEQAVENLEIAIQADPQAVVDALTESAEQSDDAALQAMFGGIVTLMTREDLEFGQNGVQFRAEAMRLWANSAGQS